MSGNFNTNMTVFGIVAFFAGCSALFMEAKTLPYRAPVRENARNAFNDCIASLKTGDLPALGKDARQNFPDNQTIEFVPNFQFATNAISSVSIRTLPKAKFNQVMYPQKPGSSPSANLCAGQVFLKYGHSTFKSF